MDNRRLIVAVCKKENISDSLKALFANELIELKIYDGSLQKVFRKNQPSAVLADIDLFNVIEDIKEIKRISDIPVIVYTKTDDLIKKLICFEIGCDDFITTKCDEREIMARIKAVMKRYGRKTENDDVLAFDGILINKTSYEVVLRGKTCVFPPKELELLYCLAAAPNKVFTREQLLDRVWGYDYYGDTRTVDVHIDRIRKKISPYENGWKLKTIYGVGYKFEIS